MNKNSCKLFGFASVGEKGQIVIPVEARKALKIKTGDRFLVMSAPHGESLVLTTPEALESFTAHMGKQLTSLQSAIKRTK